MHFELQKESNQFLSCSPPKNAVCMYECIIRLIEAVPVQ